MAVGLGTVAREWLRIGVTGFGGPPTHIALLRRLCVDRRRWLTGAEFEDGIAAVNLLPGPASTQLAIYCAWRLRGPLGAIVGGACFIGPGLVLILALSALFLGSSPPRWVIGAAAGAGAGVPAVALDAAAALAPSSWKRASIAPAARARWLAYLFAGVLAAALLGSALVIVLLLTGITEVIVRRMGASSSRLLGGLPGVALPSMTGLLAVAWVAFKVGALSYGGGFVIVPLMQHDAVSTYHWMTNAQFLDAVALGQITPGPVVLTVAVVGYAAAGVLGGILATLVAFAPSFAFVLVGGPRFGRIRASRLAQAFLNGAGPAAIGAIAGATIPLALSLGQVWQLVPLLAAAAWLLFRRHAVVNALLIAAALGVIAALSDFPLSR
jgi:chromate transporter